MAKVRKCYFCENGIKPNYKKSEALKQFLNENGGMKPSRITGVCPRHQRKLKTAIENARHLALLPIPGKGEH